VAQNICLLLNFFAKFCVSHRNQLDLEEGEKLLDSSRFAISKWTSLLDTSKVIKWPSIMSMRRNTTDLSVLTQVKKDDDTNQPLEVSTPKTRRSCSIQTKWPNEMEQDWDFFCSPDSDYGTLQGVEEPSESDQIQRQVQ
jgi:hypothetical protein